MMQMDIKEARTLVATLMRQLEMTADGGGVIQHMYCGKLDSAEHNAKWAARHAQALRTILEASGLSTDWRSLAGREAVAEMMQFESIDALRRWVRREAKKSGLRLRYYAQQQADGTVRADVFSIPEGVRHQSLYVRKAG